MLVEPGVVEFRRVQNQSGVFVTDFGAGSGLALRDQLDRGIGHYMASVAEHLLREGLPVTSVSAYSDFTDPLQAEHRADVEGTIFFSSRFQEAVLKGPGTAQLHWCAVSGWGFVIRPETPVADGGKFRWLRGGLFPPAHTVTAFVFDVWTDLRSRSSKRPMYRSPGEGLKYVAQRLQSFVPEAGSPYVDDHVYRFAHCFSETYRNRILEALLAPQQDRRQVILSDGELEALRLAAEFVEATEVAPEAGASRPSPGPGRLAQLLAIDMAHRAGHAHNPHAAAEKYRGAQHQAIVDRSSLEERPH